VSRANTTINSAPPPIATHPRAAYAAAILDPVARVRPSSAWIEAPRTQSISSRCLMTPPSGERALSGGVAHAWLVTAAVSGETAR
jgi:hypothetical protein